MEPENFESGPGGPVLRLSHLALLAHDPAAMQAFYGSVLRLAVSDRGVSRRRGREMTFLTGDPSVHHQLVLLSGGDAAVGGRRLDHLAFAVETLAELRAVRERVRGAGVTVTAVDHGNAWSIYFADCEGNRVEVFAPTPFRQPQPFSRALDLDKPDAVILAATAQASAGG